MEAPPPSAAAAPGVPVLSGTESVGVAVMVERGEGDVPREALPPPAPAPPAPAPPPLLGEGAVEALTVAPAGKLGVTVSVEMPTPLPPPPLRDCVREGVALAPVGLALPLLTQLALPAPGLPVALGRTVAVGVAEARMGMVTLHTWAATARKAVEEGVRQACVPGVMVEYPPVNPYVAPQLAPMSTSLVLNTAGYTARPGAPSAPPSMLGYPRALTPTLPLALVREMVRV